MYTNVFDGHCFSCVHPSVQSVVVHIYNYLHLWIEFYFLDFCVSILRIVFLWHHAGGRERPMSTVGLGYGRILATVSCSREEFSAAGKNRTAQSAENQSASCAGRRTLRQRRLGDTWRVLERCA